MKNGLCGRTWIFPCVKRASFGWRRNIPGSVLKPYCVSSTLKRSSERIVSDSSGSMAWEASSAMASFGAVDRCRCKSARAMNSRDMKPRRIKLRKDEGNGVVCPHQNLSSSSQLLLAWTAFQFPSPRRSQVPNPNGWPLAECWQSSEPCRKAWAS